MAYDAAQPRDLRDGGGKFAEARTRQSAYDKAGHVTSMVDPYDIETQYEYDALGRQTRVIEAVDTSIERKTVMEYDLLITCTLVTSGLSDNNPHEIKTQFQYDWLNRQTSVTEGLGRLSRTG